ncbi:MAG: AraC family transcriptional regulator [Clostridiales bacterium]|nr:AraC family transcriptional regulator [Clostridiales bacterium]MBS5878197.1 AraC family transcriptional regulator [Clostridiales bacterium]MDU3490507.1 AraC family transcriptional regulator [Clostridiales bacterium]
MKDNKNMPFIIEINESSEINRDELAHWQNSIELIEILDGSYQCHVDGGHFLSGKGDLCIINRGSIHRVLEEKSGNVQYCRKKVFIFNPDDIVDDNDIYRKYVQPLLEDNAFSHLKFNSNKGISKEIFALIDDIEQLTIDRPVGYEMESIGLIYMILRRLYLAYELKKNDLNEDFNSNVHVQRRMLSFIYDYFSDKVTLDDIAGSGRVSRSTCIRLFHEYTGKSPIDFLNSYRLEVSAQLLTSGRRPITDISQDCGFSQQSYYNKMFRKEFGMTPNEYRKKYTVISS